MKKIIPLIFETEHGRIISYAIVGDQGQYILVDIPAPIGTETWEDAIYNKLQENSISSSSITLIIISHAHIDHYGSLSGLKKKYGMAAPVAIHSYDKDFMQRGESATIIGYGAGKRGEFAKYLTTILPVTGFAPYHPEIVLEKEDNDGFLDFRLAPYGLPTAKLMHTPGHTAGSVSLVLLETKTAIIADVCFSEKETGFNKPLVHYFVQNISQLKESIGRLIDLDIKLFYGGHGGPWSASDVKQLLDEISAGKLDEVN